MNHKRLILPIKYSCHALHRMQEREIHWWLVEHAIRNGIQTISERGNVYFLTPMDWENLGLGDSCRTLAVVMCGDVVVTAMWKDEVAS